MQFKLHPAHRLARLNYLTRTVSFAFSFMVVLANLIEQHFVISTLLLGVLTLLIYPQLAYLHAALSSESKRAEMRNMNIDSIVMGIWAAQIFIRHTQAPDADPVKDPAASAAES